MNRRPLSSEPPQRNSHVWETIKLEYISSDVTLSELSQRAGYPSLRSLKRHSSQEGWPQQRAAFRRQVEQQAGETLIQRQGIELTQLLNEQLRMGRWLRLSALRLLERYLGNMVAALGTVNGEPDFTKLDAALLKRWGLSPMAMMQMMQQGFKIERGVLAHNEKIAALVDKDLRRLLEIVAHHVDQSTLMAILDGIRALDAPLPKESRPIN